MPKQGVYSCVKGKNCDLIERVCDLYLTDGMAVADVTFGKGAFWKHVDMSAYDFRPTDIKDGVDFRHLPYSNGAMDVVVLDPPYAHNPGRMFVDTTYNNAATTKGMYHKDIINLYSEGMRESHRVLKNGGLMWVKCQDEIESSVQKYSHIELYNIAEQMGFYAKDLFILMQESNPTIQHKIQKHARKNHSYLWIFKKGGR